MNYDQYDYEVISATPIGGISAGGVPGQQRYNMGDHEHLLNRIKLHTLLRKHRTLAIEKGYLVPEQKEGQLDLLRFNEQLTSYTKKMKSITGRVTTALQCISEDYTDFLDHKPLTVDTYYSSKIRSELNPDELKYMSHLLTTRRRILQSKPVRKCIPYKVSELAMATFEHDIKLGLPITI